MIPAGSIWRKRCQSVDGDGAAYNEIIVLGVFEDEIRLRPREFGSVISATEQSLRDNFTFVEQLAEPPAEDLIMQAGEWLS